MVAERQRPESSAEAAGRGRSWTDEELERIAALREKVAEAASRGSLKRPSNSRSSSASPQEPPKLGVTLSPWRN